MKKGLFYKQFVFFVRLVVSIDGIVKAITLVDVLSLLRLRACVLFCLLLKFTC